MSRERRTIGEVRAQVRRDLRASDDVRLDELLAIAEEPRGLRRQHRREPVWWWTGKAVCSAAAISLLIVLSARLVGLGLPYPLVFSGTLALLLLRRVLREVAPLPQPRPRLPSRDAVMPPPDGIAAAASRWNTRLNWTGSDPEAFSRNVRPALADLVDERLRQRHGITRASDPAQARALLGDPLWAFLSAPLTRSPTPQQFAALLAQLEAL